MQEEGMAERTKSLTSQRDGIQGTSGGIRLVGQIDFLCRNRRRGMQVSTRLRFAGEEIRDHTTASDFTVTSEEHLLAESA